MSNAKDEVLALEAERCSALTNTDIDRLDALMSDGLRFVHSSGVCDSKAVLLSKIADGSLRYLEIVFNDVEVRVFHDCAALSASMKAVAVVGGQVRKVDSRYLALWVQEPEGNLSRWRLAAYQGTPTNIE